MAESNGEKSRFADEALAKIQDLINSGELRPNQRLVESELAKKLGMSRTPLRESIKQLELMGHVTTLANGGVVVTEFSPKEIRDLFEIREALETKAMKLACSFITEERINKAREYLDLANAAMDKSDREQYQKYNMLFHETLREGCGNPRLIQLTRTLSDQYFDRRLVRLMTASEARRMNKHHKGLLKALQMRDEGAAQRTLKEHLKLATKIATTEL